MLDATLTTKANAKSPAAFNNAMSRLNAMKSEGVAKEMITAQGNTWMRLIIAGAYEIVTN